MKNKQATDKSIEELRTEKRVQEANRPGNDAWQVSRKKSVLRVLMLIGSGLLYASIFPPLNWSYLAWVAVIPLFLAVRNRTVFQAWRDGLLWGYFWALTAFFWIREIEAFIPYIMAFVLGMFPAFWAMLIPIFKRRILDLRSGEIPKAKRKFSWVPEILFVVVCAAWWVLLEWVRSWMMSGLPWNFISASQWRNISLIQICEYTGIYGISFLLIYFNIALVLAGEGLIKTIKKGKYHRPVPLILGLILLMLYVLLGAMSMLKYRTPYGADIKENSEIIKLTALVVQGNIPQCRIPRQGEAEFALEQYLKISREGVDGALKKAVDKAFSSEGTTPVTLKPDVIIWPETAVPVPYFSGHPFGTIFRFQISKLQKGNGIPLLFGTVDFGTDFENYRTQDDIPGYNAVFFMDGKNRVVDRYYKQHLVPWGEYTPMGAYYPWIKKKFGMGRDLTHGKKYTLFELKAGVKAGVQICFEDIFPYIARGFVKRGANLLIVLTNDAWYPKSSESQQHMANSVFRAVENRRPMIRSGNNNCSCLILANGVIADTVTKSIGKDGKEVLQPETPSRDYGVFDVGVLKDPPLTFYTKYGDVFVLFCGLLVIFAIMHAIWEWRKEKEQHLAAFDK